MPAARIISLFRIEFMGTAILPLDTIYEPVAAELEAVRSLFDEELQCDLPFLAELCDHIGRYRGKMLRPAVTLLAARACGGVTPAHITLAAVLEMVHVATLVHDDVLDQAELRRLSPTVNAMTDNETAVLLGDFLISHAYHLCASLDSQHASRAVSACTNTVCEGELLQVHQRENWSLTEKQYLDIVSRKTASLISVACGLGAKYAQAAPATIKALESFGMHVGVAFQVVDDVLDVAGCEDQVGKTLGLDIHGGKVTLPVIHTLKTASPQDADLLKRLHSEPRNENRQRIRELLEDGIEHAMHFAEQRVGAALTCLECLPPSPSKDSLQAMAEFILERRF